MKFISYQERRNSNGRLIRQYKVYHCGLFKIKKKVIPILGDNNKIIIGGREIGTGEKKLLDKFGKITIKGNNNIIELSDINNIKIDIGIEGNNNKIYIGKSERGSKISVFMHSHAECRELYIEDMIHMVDCCFIFLNSNRKIHIGKNCVFSWGIYIKTTDHHPVYDLETGKRINEDKDVIIGDNVWIGQDAYVSKGSVIPAGCIIGAKSFVNKIFTKEHCVIAGTPAKVVKENVCWES